MRYVSVPSGLPIPALWTKGLTGGQDFLDSGICHVHGVPNIDVTPPLGNIGIGQGNSEEDQNGADGQTAVQACRSDVIVSHPPSTVFVSDVFVEEEADNGPGKIIDRRSGWDATHTTKE